MIDRIHQLPLNADDEMRRVRAAQAAPERQLTAAANAAATGKPDDAPGVQ